MSYFPWLTILVVFPIFAGCLVFLFPYKGNKTYRWYTLCISLLELFLMTYVFRYHFQFDDPLIQLIEDYKWIDVFDFHWRLGIDGLSIGPILLTGFITTLATLAAWPVTQNSRLFYFLMLAMYSGQIGLFSSRDLLLFFLMWEFELIPVYLLLSLWGGKKRLYSATKFILYTAGSSLFFLIGVLGVGLYGSNDPTLDLGRLINQSYPVTLEILFYLGFLIAYAIKLPIIPLHTWLPDTHGEAHYSTCMLLAGILLKMGAYGLIRINMELLPHAHYIFSPWLVIVGTIQIIYAASTSFGQRNLKKRIAYSSVSHMGFLIIGIGSITNMGLNGAILQMLSHGFIGATLFFLAGTSCDRMRLVYLEEMGGISILIPKIFTMFSSFSMASLALPGMSGFVAELLVFLGLITSQKYLLMAKMLITFLMAIGMILTPIYLLSMLRQIFYGYRVFNVPNSKSFDSGPRELFLSICILLPIIGIGIYPDFILSLSVEKVQTILSNYSQK
uniref:NADH-plastoquinone oxidoreductase subunit 4 n=1 Tax=Xyris capensis TaxID=114207 RepID=UPI001F1495F3|nr:NADH-plastoquinone oxidoreductase subunit 4 [Xyris capensis]ULQ68486.1 NADH-plastoquinone oxidoreductase subunit 4 [Xyris capensis]ULQ68611.1 NADH-plastoquinone oxidoreductase subunit 4 [Xyris capensis]